MKNWIRKYLGFQDLEEKLKQAQQELETAQEEARQKKVKEAQEEARKAEEEGKTPKEIATEAKEPYIEIVSLDLDKENPAYGSFELDWNEYFILKLRREGYPGETDEVVVDLWFQNICRHILAETYEQELAGRTGDNIRYISRRDLGNGTVEVS